MKKTTRCVLAGSLLFMLAACGSGSSDSPTATSGTGTGTAATTPDATAGSQLPTIHIDTVGGNEVTSTEDYLDATVRVTSAAGVELLDASTEIRGRGNTTWGMPKKPYRLKLNQAASVLGMPADRDWALLANYADKTLVRNRLAMQLGERLGLSYNPRSRFVELVFNGNYRGVYEVYEHKKTGPQRVNVEQLDPDSDTGAATITGGYFLEVDHRLGEDVCWQTSMNIPICSKDPEFDPVDITDPAHPSQAQYNFIVGYVNSAEQAISTPGNSYQDYFDVESMVDWYLVNELMKNNDAQINRATVDSDRFTSSVHMYKPRGQKLFFGPLWDFDIAAGNINYNGGDDPTGWHIRNSAWHSLLFANSDFGQRVFAQWCQARRDGVISGLGTQVDALVAGIDRGAIDRNFERWDILGTYVWPNAFIGNSHGEEVGYLKTWLAQRAAWMHAEYVREFGECPAS